MNNAEKLDELINTHKTHIFKNALRLTGSKESAEDLIQDLIVDLYARSVNVDEIHFPKAWLSKVIYRRFSENKKREKNTITVENIDELSSDSHHALLASRVTNDEAADICTQNELIVAMNKLNPEQRSVLLLHDVEGYSLVELHEHTSIPIGTLKSRLHRARNAMQKILLQMELI